MVAASLVHPIPEAGVQGNVEVLDEDFAFYGIGAYSVVILSFQVGLPVPVAVIVSIGVCIVLSLLVAIPATRLEGFYLALATLAFAQLFLTILASGGEVTGEDDGLTAVIPVSEMYGPVARRPCLPRQEGSLE